MKLIERKYTDSNTNIFSIDKRKGIVTGTFYAEQPQEGDIIKALNYNMYVVEIMENRDAKINNENCTKDPTNAWFMLRVRAASEDEIFQAHQIATI